jgi:hypothetical protein
MAAFLEETWLLWWILAIVVILQWFAANSVDAAWEVAAPHLDDESRSQPIELSKS